jgi:hypothetical protein
MWLKVVTDDGLINADHIQAVYVKNDKDLITVTVLMGGNVEELPIAHLSSVSNAKKLINRIFQQISSNTKVIDIGLLVNQVESEK